MRRWYSPRGARRGLLFASLAAACWACWAIGFAQGAEKVRHAEVREKAQSMAPEGNDRCSPRLETCS